MELINEVKNLKEKLSNLTLTNQMYMGDWFRIREIVSYDGVNTIKFNDTNINSSLFFSPGDKIKYVQNNLTKYAYVYEVSNNKFKINGGSDFVLANQAIDELYKGISSTPSGHPVFLKYNPNITAPAPGASYSNLNANLYERAYFSLNGKMCFLKIDVVFGSLTGANSALTASLPFTADVGREYLRIPITINDNFNFNLGLAKIGASTYIEIYANHNTLGFFNITTNGLGFSITTNYIIL